MATLVENAAEVANLASAIDTAITTKGGTLVGGGKLRNAAAGIASIQTGATTTALSVAANGTYTAPTGTAYTPVTVNVPTSGYTIRERWPWKPSDWVELRDKIEEYVDPTNALYDGHQYAYAILLMATDATIDLVGGVAYRTSDGSFYSSSTATHTWDASKDLDCAEGYKYRWFIVYSDTARIVLALNSVPAKTLWFVGSKDSTISLYNSYYNRTGLLGYNSFIRSAEANFVTDKSDGWHNFRNDTNLEYVNSVDFSVNSTNNTASFMGCAKLMYVKFSNCSANLAYKGLPQSKMMYLDGPDFSSENVIPNSVNNLSLRYDWCKIEAMYIPSYNTLQSSEIYAIPKKLLASSNSVYGAFQDSSYIKIGPDELYFPDVTNTGRFMSGCTGIMNLPTKLNCGTSISFAFMTGFAMPDTLAEFDADGNIIGGLAYGITAASSTLTITLNSTIKGFFDSTQQSAIESAFNAKNWTLAW